MLFVIILILSLIANFFVPWWAAAIVAFLAAYFLGQTSGQAFWSGFIAIFLLWIVLSLFKSVPNDHIMVARMSALLHLPHWSLMLLITAFIGGVTGGLAALSGELMQKAFQKRQPH
ncbi:MAG: hypothetical protein ACOH2A_14430 [Sphingobacteriaceae bacterium]